MFQCLLYILKEKILKEKTLNQTSASFFVSVIIPVFNGAAFLPAAVDSIQRQTHHPLEIIIIDDGSTDATAVTVAELGGGNNHYFYQPNSGPAAARNRGIKMARGNVIAFLDADDLWPNNKLELQLTRLANEPLLEIVVGMTQFMRLTKMKTGQSQFEPFQKPQLFLNFGNAVFRKSVFDKIGLFDETMGHSEDIDWWLRAREQDVSIFILDDVTLLYRMHSSNMSIDKSARHFFFIKALKQSLDRRRQHNIKTVKPFSDYQESHKP